jgi:hypothetical protein
MKRNIGIILAAVMAGSVVAQEVTNAPPAPAISTSAPAAEASVTNATTAAKTNAPSTTTKKAQKKKAPPKRVFTQTHTVPLTAV